MVTRMGAKCGLSVIIILMVLSTTASNETNYEEDRISELKLVDSLLKKYDRRATPTNRIGVPTQVGCEIFIRSFGSISEKTMDYKVDLYLRQHWEDPRMNDSAIRGDLDLNDPKLVQAIWKPEVYFPNAKDAEFQYVTVPNVLLRLKPNGQILYMLRLKLTFSCMMELNKYPLDDQICTMEIASFSKTTRELILRWVGDLPVELSKEVKMPQFVVRKVVPASCDSEAVVGNYSCLVAKFYLSRSIGFHMVQSYIPTILIVIVSWVSFFMDLDSVPGRVTLGVTTLLTVSSKSAGLATDSPQVSYIKAIDIWMGACTVFIFAALLEFTFVNYLWRKHCKSRPQVSRTIMNPLHSTSEGNLDVKQVETCLLPVEEKQELRRRYHQSSSTSLDKRTKEENDDVVNFLQERNGMAGIAMAPFTDMGKASRCNADFAVRIDEMCRVLFPASFCLFNGFYWWYYLYYYDPIHY